MLNNAEPRIVDLDTNEVLTNQVVSTEENALVPVNHQVQSLSQQPLLFNQGTIMTTAGKAFGAGVTTGCTIGKIYAPKVAEQARDAVFKAIEEQTDKLAETIAETTGLNRIPGGELALANQGTDLAHAAGEKAYQNTINEMTVRSGAIGGLAAGALTIAVMEGANLFYYGYQCYQERQERLAREEAQRQTEIERQRLLTRTEDLNNGKLVNFSENQDNEELDFVMVEEGNDDIQNQTETVARLKL